MIIINTQFIQKEVSRIQRELQTLAKDIKNDSQEKVLEVGNLGFNYAYNLAPEFTGALKAAMRLEIGDNEAWIISSQPVGDAIPTHIIFDTGKFGNMTMYGPGGTRVKFEPFRENSIGFMWKTYELLKQEFSQRMNMAISHSIQKVGRKV